MASSDIAGASDRKLLVALHHPRPERAGALRVAIEAAGLAVRLLPQHVDGLRTWVDDCFDILLINPFLGWQEPFEFVRLARSIAGRRPLLILSDRDSLDERMVALDAGADDAVGWTGNLPEVLARIASLLRRSRIAAGQLGEGELRIDLIDRRVERAGRIIRLPLRDSTCSPILRACPTGRCRATRCSVPCGGSISIPAPTGSRCICRGCAPRSIETSTGRCC
jgi:DNA-binding response OmpR family regulator